jgi:hypothetical protein
MNRQASLLGAGVLAVLLAFAVAGCFVGGPVDNSCGVILGVTPGNSAIRIGDPDTLAATVLNSCGTQSDPTVTWKVQDTTVLSVQSAGATSIIVVGRAHGNSLVRATANADTTVHVDATVFVQ